MFLIKTGPCIHHSEQLQVGFDSAYPLTHQETLKAKRIQQDTFL